MFLKYRNLCAFTLMAFILALCGVNTAAAGKRSPINTGNFNGRAYAVYDVSMTWHEAKAYCESLGGHLATITSAEEQLFVQSLIEDGSMNQYWLGATETTGTIGGNGGSEEKSLGCSAGLGVLGKLILAGLSALNRRV